MCESSVEFVLLSQRVFSHKVEVTGTALDGPLRVGQVDVVKDLGGLECEDGGGGQEEDE